MQCMRGADLGVSDAQLCRTLGDLFLCLSQVMSGHLASFYHIQGNSWGLTKPLAAWSDLVVVPSLRIAYLQ